MLTDGADATAPVLDIDDGDDDVVVAAPVAADAASTSLSDIDDVNTSAADVVDVVAAAVDLVAHADSGSNGSTALVLSLSTSM